MKLREQDVAGQACWIVENGNVRVAVTRRGGMTAPVTFCRDTPQPVEPYYVSPWQGEGLKLTDPVLVPLRGNFFCLPFGAGGSYQKDNYVTHGEPATAEWRGAKIASTGRVVTFKAEMKTKVRPGRIGKEISLVNGQNVLYVRHVVEGYTGKMPLGYHSTLKGDNREDAILLSFSPYQFGMTSFPSTPLTSAGEYYSLQPGKQFKSLSKVPTAWKDYPSDRCDSFPRRQGFCDIIQIYAKQTKKPGWSAAVRPADGYLWFTLKDTRVLPSTILWMENHGRHGFPWNGRNCCIGVEDVCSYMADGMGPSIRKNPASEAGIPTAHMLSAERPLSVNYIEGVVKIPRGFDRVAKAAFPAGAVEFTSESGKSVTAPVHHGFVFSGDLDR
ncbi:MAG TPA: hypothetical protein VMW87_05125 [Spirochaetia bacterium]|nr:hypothetical protein [Spirochaetia bacterium]